MFNQEISIFQSFSIKEMRVFTREKKCILIVLTREKSFVIDFIKGKNEF
jgi:hypothetical protein